MQNTRDVHDFLHVKRLAKKKRSATNGRLKCMLKYSVSMILYDYKVVCEGVSF